MQRFSNTKAPLKTSSNLMRARKVKVMHVITRSELGGAAVHVRDLAESLRDRVEPVIVTGEDGFLCDEARRAGIPLYRMEHMIRPVRPWTDLAGIAELATIINLERPDLIHAHTSKAGIIGRIAATLTGTKKVFTAHSWSFMEGSSKIQDGISVVVERLAAYLGGPIVMVSENNSSLARARKVGRPEQLTTVWNGIQDTIHRARHGQNTVPHIVMAARFVRQKDQATLLQALAGLDSDWKLTLAGDGPQLGDAQALAARLGILDRVSFPGSVHAVSELLARSDIFVLSSINEGLPLCVLEAMRAGLPVVVSDAGGTAEAVSEGITGYVVPVRDFLAMRQRLKTLVEDASLRARMGAAARALFEQHFRLEVQAAKTMAVYRQVLGLPESDWVESNATGSAPIEEGRVLA